MRKKKGSLWDSVGRSVSKNSKGKPKKHWLTKKVNKHVNKSTRPLNKVGRKKSKRTKRKRRR